MYLIISFRCCYSFLKELQYFPRTKAFDIQCGMDFPNRGARYLEVDVDVGSSRTAASVVGLVQGAITTLVVDIAVLLEGHEQVRSCLLHAPVVPCMREETIYHPLCILIGHTHCIQWPLPKVSPAPFSLVSYAYTTPWSLQRDTVQCT